MSTSSYLAVDLGAESGRVMLGTLDQDRLALEEIDRFPNGPVAKGAGLFWDLAKLEKEIFAGIEKAARRGAPIAGLSANSWGVDYVLLGDNNEPVTEARCYRDPRNNASVPRLSQKISPAGIYAETGIQLMAINTLFQLEAGLHADPGLFQKARHFLNIADYFNARFSGVAAAEQSLASTTEIYNPQRHAWSEKLIATLGLPGSFFPRIVPGGSVLGPVTGPLREEATLASAKVIATCSHDTGAAVAAVPAQDGRPWAYLSSGTWSLLGTELPSPVLTEAAREAGFTNEVGLGGKIRFLKNIAGLWILQECRRAWETAGQKYSYDDLTRLASENGPAPAHFSLDDSRFLSPGDMPEKIAAYCRETNQPIPSTPGQFVRTVLESLALCYADTLTKLENLTGQKIETLHIVGGGTRNDLLNQLTANAVKRKVVTGPVEATAAGNVLIQALALGHLESVARLRRIVEASFPTRVFNPLP
ncbi:MAG TPA: rhamnulokinase family protein [Candidatus Methylacidiphilales bacterium]|nr:rhamnulokinase family protein [Candidatus Methylacidiphilales bacterium]